PRTRRPGSRSSRAGRRRSRRSPSPAPASRRARRGTRPASAAPGSGRGRRRRRGRACTWTRTLPDYHAGVSTTLTPPRERLGRGEGTGLGRPWHVIVRNDDHNTFQGVAAALAAVLPGVSYDRGLELANRIHNTGQ